MKKAKKKSLNIGVSRYLLPSLLYFPSVSDRWFGEGLEVRPGVSQCLLPLCITLLRSVTVGSEKGTRLLFRYIVAILLLVVGVGQGVHAQYVITKETARCLTKQDSFLLDNFGQKVDGQLKSSYRADTVSLIDKYFRRGMSRKGILMIPKGKRPAPETYLKRRYIRRHLKNFKAGASCIVSKELLERHHGDSIGKADNSQFIMMKSEMDSVLMRSHGDLSRIEHELGIPAGAWKHRVLVRIDIPKPKKLRLRMPSGNEVGANVLWLPGGLLPTGYKEAVIDRIPKGRYKASLIEITQ
nr:hypothetical protein [uncultured Prevotella sp.]